MTQKQRCRTVTSRHIVRFFRPRLEALEDRLVLAGMTFYWGGNGATNNASEAANWTTGIVGDPQAVPGNGDIAILDGVVRHQGAAPNQPVIFDANFNATLAKLWVKPTYTGSVTVSNTLTITQIDQEVGPVTVASMKTLSVRTYTQTGGTLAGGGTLSITGMPGNEGNLEFRGAATHSLDAIVIGPSSSLVFNNHPTFDGTTITNNGTTRWIAGSVDLQNAAEFINNGAFNISADAWVLTGMAGTSFTNNGTVALLAHFRPEPGFNIDFVQNPGAVLRVTTGIMTLGSDTSFQGLIDIQPGSELRIFEGGHTLKPGILVTGAGTLNVLAGEVLIDPVLDLQLLTTRLRIGLGKITGGGSLTALSTFDWEGGTIEGLRYFRTEGETRIAAQQGVALTLTTYEQAGHAVWEEGNISLTDAVFSNLGQFDIRTNASMEDTSPQGLTSRFENLVTATERGQVKKLAGGENLFSVTVHTYGDLLCYGGNLRFEKEFQQLGSTSWTDLADGRITVAASSGYALLGGTLAGGGTIAGNLSVLGGTVAVGLAAAPDLLIVTGNYTQAAGATLEVKAGSAANHGSVQVWGNASLAGSLRVTLLSGYAPPAGTALDVLMAFGDLSGILTMPLDPGWTTVVVNDTLRAVRS